MHHFVVFLVPWMRTLQRTIRAHFLFAGFYPDCNFGDGRIWQREKNVNSTFTNANITGFVGEARIERSAIVSRHEIPGLVKAVFSSYALRGRVLLSDFRFLADDRSFVWARGA
jgi:hypothetical protein